jgi:ADP-heptose:LPS heptosyltransferase
LEPVNLGKRLGVLERGSWIMHDINAFEISQRAERRMARVNSYLMSDGDPTGPVLVMRSGAIGDLLLLTPALAMLAKTEKVHLCCFTHHFEIFAGNSDVVELVSYPLKFGDAAKYSRIISLENTMECDHTQHATDVFSQALGFATPPSDYRPKYLVLDEEKEATKQHLFGNRPNIVVQMRASVANRDYTPSGWLEVLVKLEQRGWGVLLIGHKGQIPDLPPQWQNPFIRDLSKLGLTFRQSAAVLAQADAFLGIDSAFAHLSHALDIPAVVLFGPFSWKTRTLHAPKTTAIHGKGACAPCSWHMHAGQMFPPNKPCTRIQQCVVLAEIEPARILAKCDLMKP